jgi:hypothetical protein
MKLLILGATGNSGSRLARMGLAEGHEVTAFVRSERKLVDLLGGQLPQEVRRRERLVRPISGTPSSAMGGFPQATAPAFRLLEHEREHDLSSTLSTGRCYAPCNGAASGTPPRRSSHVRGLHRRVKAALYARFGVPCYWILGPAQRQFEGYVLAGKAYRLSSSASGAEVVTASPFADLAISLVGVWA